MDLPAKEIDVAVVFVVVGVVCLPVKYNQRIFYDMHSPTKTPRKGTPKKSGKSPSRGASALAAKRKVGGFGESLDKLTLCLVPSMSDQRRLIVVVFALVLGLSLLWFCF